MDRQKFHLLKEPFPSCQTHPSVPTPKQTNYYKVNEAIVRLKTNFPLIILKRIFNTQIYEQIMLLRLQTCQDFISISKTQQLLLSRETETDTS